MKLYPRIFQERSRVSLKKFIKIGENNKKKCEKNRELDQTFLKILPIIYELKESSLI